MAREFQLIGYLRLLAEYDVAYLLVGGIGARIQGSATTTQDIDIMPEPSVENLERLARALSDETTEKKEAGATEYQLHALIDPMEFRTADISSFRTRFGVMDVLMELPGVGPFDAVRRNARRYQWETITITVASIDDIITSKETADRAKTAARSMRSTRRGTIFVSTPTRTNYRRAPWIPSRRTTNSDELPWR